MHMYGKRMGYLRILSLRCVSLGENYVGEDGIFARGFGFEIEKGVSIEGESAKKVNSLNNLMVKLLINQCLLDLLLYIWGVLL